MEQLYDYLYRDIALKPAGIALGVLLIVVHAFCFLKSDATTAWLRKFPRNKTAGIVLLAIGSAWCYMIITNMDLGEFHPIERFVQLAIPLGFVLIVFFADEFLAVRALGVVMLLAACPLLIAAFLEPPVTRLLLPVLGYAWILFGLFWVGMPYLMREGIDWVTGNAARWRGACLAGAGYGALMIICALIFY